MMNNLKYKIFPQTSNLPHNEASDDFNKFIRGDNEQPRTNLC